MKVDKIGADTHVVLRVEGEVDLKTSGGLRDEVQVVFREKSKALFIDLTAVGYMDSSGVATLVEAFGLAGRAKIPFGLISPQSRVMDILSLAHLNDIFTIHVDESAARASLSR